MPTMEIYNRRFSAEHCRVRKNSPVGIDHVGSLLDRDNTFDRHGRSLLNEVDHLPSQWNFVHLNRIDVNEEREDGDDLPRV